MYDLVFDCGQHPFKLLRLSRDHIGTQIGISSDGPVLKNSVVTNSNTLDQCNKKQMKITYIPTSLILVITCPVQTPAGSTLHRLRCSLVHNALWSSHSRTAQNLPSPPPHHQEDRQDRRTFQTHCKPCIAKGEELVHIHIYLQYNYIYQYSNIFLFLLLY